ncbi:MAG: HDOD domain-containing protein [Deltaproteobacteria bacterium]|nr:HDOD domain-containing protein [Deltaproteobacteria bacterium]
MHSHPTPPAASPLRALIVDDVPEISFAVARYLGQHCAGGALIANSAAEALTQLETMPVHIVISDLRMPNRDGISFLAEVHRRWPATLRVLLTGQSQWESALLAVPHCHQFISKPVELHHLGALLARVSAWLDPTLDAATADSLGGLAMLPSAQASLVALHGMLASPHPRSADLATVIRRDPGLSAKVLQIANASFFGGGSRISDVDGATSLLGASYLQDLHRRGALMTPARNGGMGAALDVDALARHALVVAQTAKATLKDPRAAEAAYSAGLLHSVGWFAMAAAHPGLVGDASQVPPGMAERLGAQLLSFWGLPSQIVSAVAQSFYAPEEETFGPASAVHLARGLANVIGQGDLGAIGPRVSLSDDFVIKHNLQTRLPALLDKASNADIQARRSLSPIPGAVAV